MDPGNSNRKTEKEMNELTRAARKKIGYPDSFWENQEKRVAASSDTSRMNPDPQFEDEVNITISRMGKRHTIPYNEKRRGDKQITYPQDRQQEMKKPAVGRTLSKHAVPKKKKMGRAMGKKGPS